MSSKSLQIDRLFIQQYFRSLDSHCADSYLLRIFIQKLILLKKAKLQPIQVSVPDLPKMNVCNDKLSFHSLRIRGQFPVFIPKTHFHSKVRLGIFNFHLIPGTGILSGNLMSDKVITNSMPRSRHKPHRPDNAAVVKEVEIRNRFLSAAFQYFSLPGRQ